MPRSGLHLTSDTARRYLEDAGVDPAELSTVRARNIRGAQRDAMHLYSFAAIERIVLRHEKTPPDLRRYLTKDQKGRHAKELAVFGASA